MRWLNNKVGGGWQGLIPFLIEDVTPRDERLPTVRAHANGVTGINTIALATDDVGPPAAVMAALLGIKDQPVVAPFAGASGLRFDLGGQALDYLAPKSAEGLLAAHLAGNRPAPYAVSFKTTGASKRLDPAETEGVRIEFTTV